MTDVYVPTTAPNPSSSCCMLPSPHLDWTRFWIKVLEVVLSLVAFILEETVSSCISCSSLYFFEFVSCSAFLFTLLLLILLSTSLHSRVGINSWPRLDFLYTAAIFLLFIIASIVFTAENGGTTLERCAVAFGFLASFSFLLDVVYFLWKRGFPFRKEAAAAPGGPNGTLPNDQPEMDKLNANGTE